MDAHIGDLHPSIVGQYAVYVCSHSARRLRLRLVDREIEVVQSLSDRVLRHEEAMQSACDVCAELDCLLSFAEASAAGSFVRPKMVEENIIDIKQGRYVARLRSLPMRFIPRRHPLQELVVDTFVPNDAFVVGGCGAGTAPDVESEDDVSGCDSRDRNSIVVCTGANACGKVSLGYFCTLTRHSYGRSLERVHQAGRHDPVHGANWMVKSHHVHTKRLLTRPSFVPAASATLGVVDKSNTSSHARIPW